MKLLVTAAGIIVSCYFAYLKISIRELRDHGSLPLYLTDLEESSVGLRYRAFLQGALDGADSFFGPKLLGAKAFNRCLFIAFAYPVLFAVIGWALTGQSLLTGLFPDNWHWTARAVFLVSVVMYVSAIPWIVSNSRQIDARLEAELASRFPILIKDDVWAVHLIVITLVSAVGEYIILDEIRGIFLLPAFASFGGAISIPWAAGVALFGVAVIINAISVPVGFVVGAFVFALGSAAFYRIGSKILRGPSIYSYTGALVALVMIFGAIIIQHGWTELFSGDYYYVIVFFVVLPLLNAVCDTSSLAFSRWMGRELLKDFNKYRAILLASLDLVIAIGLLFALTILLSITVSMLDHAAQIAGSDAQIDLLDMLVATTVNPLSMKGTWIILILGSTLVPTLVHLCCAVASLFALKAHPAKRQKWVRMIDDVLMGNDDKEALPLRTCREIANYMFWHRWFGAVLLSGILVVGIYGLWSHAVGDMRGALIWAAKIVEL